MTKFLAVDLAGVHKMVDGLAADTEAAARPAAQAAAQVLYETVRRNAQQLGQHTGKLVAAVYQAYSEQHSGPGHATYHISWNPRKAPHGGLVEFGFIQRYVSYIGSDGNWYTAIRPSARGKPRPGRNAPQSVKDAYYVPLPAPRQVAAKAFVRRAQSAAPLADLAAETKLLEIINRGNTGK